MNLLIIRVPELLQAHRRLQCSPYALTVLHLLHRLLSELQTEARSLGNVLHHIGHKLG
mgnify:CR=1 FL=1